MIVGASGMDEVNTEDFTNMVVDPSPRSDVDLHIKSLSAPWTQAKIKDIGLPAFMEWLTDDDGDGNLHGCTLLINLVDQLNYQSSQVKASVTRTITAAKKEYASLHPDDDADGGVAQFVLDSLLKDCGSWVAHLRDSQPHSALTSGQRRDAMSLAFAWHDRSRWLADADVDKEDVAAQYTTFINSMPLHLRVPLMLGLSDPSMRSMMDLSGNFFVPASFLEFVYALCNQHCILALPFEHIDDWRRSVIEQRRERQARRLPRGHQPRWHLLRPLHGQDHGVQGRALDVARPAARRRYLGWQALFLEQEEQRGVHELLQGARRVRPRRPARRPRGFGGRRRPRRGRRGRFSRRLPPRQHRRACC